MIAWSWPGKVRELENFIERAVILSRGTTLRAPLDEMQSGTLEPMGNQTLEQVERELVFRVFRESEGLIRARIYFVNHIDSEQGRIRATIEA